MTDAIVTKESTAIAEYQLDISPEEIHSLIVSNVGEDQLSITNLDRAINPSGKSVQWEIPSLEDKPETTDVIEGVIVFHKLSRARWEGEYKGGGEPPVCTSRDGITGEGTPGGKCQACPYAKFTENAKGENERPECRVVKQLFIRRPGELLPVIVNITAVNLNQATNYLLGLATKKRKSHEQVVTRIRNETATSKSGFQYAKTHFSIAAMLPPEQAAEMTEYKNMVKPMLMDVEITEADVDESTEQPF